MELTSLGPPVRITHTEQLNVCEHSDVIHHIEYDYYSRRLALVSTDKSVSVYDKLAHNRGWTKTGDFRVNGGATWRVRWAHACFGQILATASFDGNVYIFQERSSMNDDIEERDPLITNKADLIECNWTQKCHLTSAKPTAITDIRFAPHFNGLILGVCNGLGQVFIYECPGPDNLDSWTLVQKMSIFKPRRCRAIAFSTDRFSTLLIAVCSDDDRVKDNQTVAIFAFARTELHVPYPEVIFLEPSAETSVLLPPVDLEFSPTGAFEYQRLAIAFGPCVIIYHVTVIEKDTPRPDSPLSTISENSVNTIILNVQDSRTDEELLLDDDDISIDSDMRDSQCGVTSDSSKDSKQTKKSVHFNIKPPTPPPERRSLSPQIEIATCALQREEEELDLANERLLQASLSPKHQNRTGSSITTNSSDEQYSQRNNVGTEEDAEDADSETSECTTADSLDNKSQNSPALVRVERAYHWTEPPISQKTHSAIFSDDEASAPPPLFNRDFGSYARKKPDTPKPAESESDVFDAKRKSKPKRKRMPASDNKSTDDEESSPIPFDTFSNVSNKSAPVSAVLKAVRNFAKDRRPQSSASEIILPPPSLAIEARATPEFNVVDGRTESATIKISGPSSRDDEPTVVTDILTEEDDSNTVRIIMERKAVLVSNQSQVRRISYNHTGSLLTVVYVDGRVRVWKHVNPMLWQCLTVVDPPMIKGKEGIEVTREKAYY